MSRTRRHTLIVVFILFLLPGCGGRQAVTPESLQAARKLWTAADVRDYDLEWTSSGQADGHYLVYVRGGKVKAIHSVLPDGRQIEAKPARPEMYGIDGLFQILEEEEAQGKEEQPFGRPKGSKVILKFSPDAKLGYPKSYRRDVTGSPKGLAIDVVKLDTQPKSEVPKPKS